MIIKQLLVNSENRKSFKGYIEKINKTILENNLENYLEPLRYRVSQSDSRYFIDKTRGVEHVVDLKINLGIILERLGVIGIYDSKTKLYLVEDKYKLLFDRTFNQNEGINLGTQCAYSKTKRKARHFFIVKEGLGNTKDSFKILYYKNSKIKSKEVEMVYNIIYKVMELKNNNFGIGLVPPSTHYRGDLVKVIFDIILTNPRLTSDTIIKEFKDRVRYKNKTNKELYNNKDTLKLILDKGVVKETEWFVTEGYLRLMVIQYRNSIKEVLKQLSKEGKTKYTIGQSITVKDLKVDNSIEDRELLTFKNKSETEEFTINLRDITNTYPKSLESKDRYTNNKHEKEYKISGYVRSIREVEGITKVFFSNVILIEQ